VVFTPSNAVLQRASPVLEIDLNNDGVADFNLYEYFISTIFFSFDLRIYGQGKDISQVEQYSRGREFLPALTEGTRIGGGGSFTTWGNLAYREAHSSTGKGYFINTTNRSLGVKFTINGQVHYGWIGFRRVGASLTAKLYGWAYETEPNKAILAGDTGSDSTVLRSAEPCRSPKFHSGQKQRQFTVQF
jgi:hypothetical protein